VPRGCGKASVAVSLNKGGGGYPVMYLTIPPGVWYWDFPKSGVHAVVVKTTLVHNSGIQNLLRTRGNASVVMSLKNGGGVYRAMYL